MKLWVSIIAFALFLATFAPTAAAQDGMPTAGVTQVHAEKWDWGYVGMSPIFGFSLGDRFDLTAAGFTEFGTDPIMGAKFVLGFGSNSQFLGTEFHATFIRYSYSGTLISSAEYGTSQMFGKIGFNLIAEFLSNESITDEGQVLKDGTVGLSGFAGLYWLTFFGGDFDLIPQDPTNDTEVTDETLWLRFGVMADFPFSNEISLVAHASMDMYLYHLSRLLPIGKVDTGSINFETFTEKTQITLGGMLVFTPFLHTDGGHHWRFFVGANFVLVESPQPNQLLFSGGVNFGW